MSIQSTTDITLVHASAVDGGGDAIQEAELVLPPLGGITPLFLNLPQSAFVGLQQHGPRGGGAVTVDLDGVHVQAVEDLRGDDLCRRIVCGGLLGLHAALGPFLWDEFR